MREIEIVEDTEIVDDKTVVVGVAVRLSDGGSITEYQVSIGDSDQLWAASMRRDGCSDEEIEEARRKLRAYKLGRA